MADTEDDNATTRSDEITQVSTVHIVNALSHSISTDGTSAALVFEIADDAEDSGKRKFMITMPVQAVAPIKDLMIDLHRHAKNRALDAGSFVVHAPSPPPKRCWGIGFDPRAPMATTLVFNMDDPDVYAVALPNLEAYMLGAALQRDVGPKLSVEERRQSQMLPAQLLKPNKSLIRP